MRVPPSICRKNPTLFQWDVSSVVNRLALSLDWELTCSPHQIPPIKPMSTTLVSVLYHRPACGWMVCLQWIPESPWLEPVKAPTTGPGCPKWGQNQHQMMFYQSTTSEAKTKAKKLGVHSFLWIELFILCKWLWYKSSHSDLGGGSTAIYVTFHMNRRRYLIWVTVPRW